MSIPRDSLWRGCAANFRQPISEDDQHEAEFWVAMLIFYNCHHNPSPLRDIVYRSSTYDEDICRHVFCWDLTPFEEVFQNGFRARRQEGTRDDVYISLERYVNHGGRPLDSRRDTTHAFISTTLSSQWHPTVDPGTEQIVYRYEIYAPGGIWVAATLGDRYRHPCQEEVCFVEGIAPQYIRAAQAFRLTTPTGSRHTNSRRVDTILIVNENFNPQAHPQRSLRLMHPIFMYRDEEGNNRDLTICKYRPPTPERKKRQVPTTTDSKNAIDWYGGDVANCESYIDAAFRSSYTNEAYLFMKNEYVLVNYATNKLLSGPLRISEGYPSLRDTAFAEYGIDCAFASHKVDEAFIFSGNLCAKINYAPHNTDNKILKGPITIAEMFPFFKWTVFENGVDAAFESSISNEAYIFKDNRYARINYNNPSLIYAQLITDGFDCFKGTIFASGVEAAFASHCSNEAYLFKGDCYARFKFVPDSRDDIIIDDERKILPNWPSLGGILPRKNQGLDVYDYTGRS